MLNRKGMSLAEILFTAGILVGLIAAMTTAFYTTVSLFQFTDKNAVLYSDARYASRYIADELRRTNRSIPYFSLVQDSPASGTDSLTYRIPPDIDDDGVPDLDGNNQPDWAAASDVVIALDAASGELRRTEGAAVTVLARNVQTVNFLDNTIDPSLYEDELRIVIALQDSDFRGNTYSVTFTSNVNMRN